ncbi:MAG: lasso peptide biosynthesis PqqD family chaperone [Candidatus Thiosymbion ectosymbiont of Robbea hypermnestra]|nr:lasso peptide biosynthesis PqqD family chaperone [Candidatus Thiosymbion ectosymbiont of Robbea hypermnestra]
MNKDIPSFATMLRLGRVMDWIASRKAAKVGDNHTEPDEYRGMPLTITDTICRGNDLVFSDIEGEVVMMSIEKGNYYCLNEVGSRIWQLIEQPTTLADVCHELQEDFQVEPAACEQEVFKFAEKMVTAGLIEVQSRAV